MVLTEGRLYIRKLTPLKAVNLFKLWISFHISKVIRRPIIWGMPASVTIEPTTACNLSCPECPSGLKSFTRPTGNASLSLVNSFLEDQAKTITYINFYFQGEPFIHKSILEMISAAHQKRVFTATSTNAHFVNEKTAEGIINSGLDKLIISLDGITQETYESYRVDGNLNKVLEGTRILVKKKKELKSSTPLLVFQFLVVRPNEHEIEGAEKLAKELGVDKITFKTAQIYDYEKGSPLIPDNPKYSRYRLNSDGLYEIKNRLDNQCWRMWRGSVLTWDGKVVPCCFDKDASHQMGDLNANKFREIWRSEGYNSFRSGVLQSRSQIDICKNCSEGTKVWA